MIHGKNEAFFILIARLRKKDPIFIGALLSLPAIFFEPLQAGFITLLAFNPLCG